MRRSALEPVLLTDDERQQLERWARRPKSTQALALRCRIVLECAKGGHNLEVAARMGVDPKRWASGGGVFSPTAWTGSTTSHGRGHHAP